MKKSNFTALVLGTISGVLFSIGMCMAMIPEWNAFQPGIIFGCVGLVLALITLLIWRRMENKAPIHLDSKTVLTVIVGIVGVLALGVGMCFSMIWGEMIKGIIIGLIGIIVLFTLIPLTKGIQE
jgi:O-antigen/teichoic acid export membrane protein